MLIGKFVVSILMLIVSAHSDRITPIVHQASSPALAVATEQRSPIRDIYYPQIAHAGGGYNGIIYTNSLEALESNYQAGYRMIEVDLNYTSDGAIVLLHDWDNVKFNLTGKSGVQSRDEFMADGKSVGLTFLDISQLCDWLNNRKDVRIVLDSKVDSLGVLKKVSTLPQCPKNQLIPYINSASQYPLVKNMGFNSLMLLAQTLSAGDALALTWLKNDPNFSLALSQVNDRESIQKITQLGIRTYIWTIDDIDTSVAFKRVGAFGTITNFIRPQ